MGFIQASCKNFSERVPHALTAFEVWEHAGFEGNTVHLKGLNDSMPINRAHRTVYETSLKATDMYEAPLRRCNAKTVSEQRADL